MTRPAASQKITHDEALQAVREGATHVNEVKAWPRVGMGRCQGRMCGAALAELFARATGRSAAEAGVFTTRPPVKPVCLAALTEGNPMSACAKRLGHPTKVTRSSHSQ